MIVSTVEIRKLRLGKMIEFSQVCTAQEGDLWIQTVAYQIQTHMHNLKSEPLQIQG